MKAIETRYRGYRFRSRLEARWAVYFDALKLEWQYEPQGYDLGDGVRYLPDFWLPQVRMWGEVKPEPFVPDELDKARRLHAQTGNPVLLLIGPPSAASYWAVDGEDDAGQPVYCDYVISMYHGYPLTEHRFYASTGEACPPDQRPSPLADGFHEHMIEDVAEAVIAARSARFEHGEIPRY